MSKLKRCILGSAEGGVGTNDWTNGRSNDNDPKQTESQVKLFWHDLSSGGWTSWLNDPTVVPTDKGGDLDLSERKHMTFSKPPNWSVWSEFQDFVQRIFLFSTNGRNKLAKGKTTLLSMFFWVSAVNAESMGTASNSEANTFCPQFLTAIHKELHEFLQVFTPANSTPRILSPPHILTACLLTTTWTVCLFSLCRTQRLMKYFFSIGTLASTLAGILFAVDIPDFVFRYLFLGINLALILSMVYHRFSTKHAPMHEEEENAYAGKEKFAILG